jgi:hypothetical protein
MAKYRDAERDAARKIRNAKRNFEKKLAKEKHGNSRPFFSYIKGETKSKVTIGPLKDNQKNTVSGDEEMANVLNNYFASVFTDEGDIQLPEEEQMEWRTSLSDIQINTAKVAKKIRDLRSSSAPGPDQIVPALLQELTKEVAPILAIIFQKSLESGDVPADWRTANVTQYSKKGLSLSPAITAQ